MLTSLQTRLRPLRSGHFPGHSGRVRARSDLRSPHATRDQLRLPGLGRTASAAAVATARRTAERLGYHSVWTAEAYGTDAVTPLDVAHGATPRRINFGSAIMQMPARTPAMTAMTAATLDLHERRPVPPRARAVRPAGRRGLARPALRQAARRRASTSTSCARSSAREAPLEHHGAHYDIPYRGPDATGLGKPLKIIVHPRRADIPIYLAAIGPKNVAARARRSPTAGSRSSSRRRASRDRTAPRSTPGFAKAGGGKSARPTSTSRRRSP